MCSWALWWLVYRLFKPRQLAPFHNTILGGRKQTVHYEMWNPQIHLDVTNVADDLKIYYSCTMISQDISILGLNAATVLADCFRACWRAYTLSLLVWLLSQVYFLL